MTRTSVYRTCAYVLLTMATACAPKAPPPPPGPPPTVEVSEFLDFECPFCRSLYATMKPILAHAGDRVHVTRHHVPLAMHVHAAKAARAAVCAEVAGRGDAMADLLMTTPLASLADDDYVTLAEKIGVPRDGFMTCVNADSTTQRLVSDTKLYRELGARGLPLVSIGGELLEGDQDPPVVQKALDEAMGK